MKKEELEFISDSVFNRLYNQFIMLYGVWEQHGCPTEENEVDKEDPFDCMSAIFGWIIFEDSFHSLQTNDKQEITMLFHDVLATLISYRTIECLMDGEDVIKMLPDISESVEFMKNNDIWLDENEDVIKQ